VRAQRWPRVLAAVVVAVVLVVVALLVADDSGGASSAAAHPHGYCAAALPALRARTPASLRRRLAPAIAEAPRDLRPTLVALRDAEPGTPDARRLRRHWQHVTTDACCTCIGGQHAPEVVGDLPS